MCVLVWCACFEFAAHSTAGDEEIFNALAQCQAARLVLNRLCPVSSLWSNAGKHTNRLGT